MTLLDRLTQNYGRLRLGIILLAAILSPKVLSEQIDALYFPSNHKEKPTAIVKNAIKAAKSQYADILLIDTAGRLHIDNEMMDEIEKISGIAKPTETLFVVDSMTGQDADRNYIDKN